jgi:hypothetical protein
MIRAWSMRPGMRITRDVEVGGGVFKPSDPLTVIAVYLFRDRADNWVLLMVFAGCDLWPLPWCYDFRPASLVEIVDELPAVNR